MQSSLPEKHQEGAVPPVPIKTYQWEDVKRARIQGGYPWTHLDKPPLEGEDITAEFILKNSAPIRRSMSREPSRDRSGGRSPTPSGDGGPQKILMLDASPGSSRKLGESEDDGSVHIPNFSKEISLDSEEDILEKDNVMHVDQNQSLPGPANVDSLPVVNEPKITVSPKGILKRKHPDRPQIATNNDDSPRNSKCCHPFVEKIKHIADKTIHKAEKNLHKKATLPKRKPPIDEPQEIIPLDCSPGLERREKQKHHEDFQKEKDGVDDVKISLVMQTDSHNPEKEPIASTNANNIFSIPSEFLAEPSPPTRKRKEHIYEDIEKDDADMETASPTEDEQSLSKVLDEPENTKTKVDVDQKSGDSKDPSLLIDEPMEDEESTSESISKVKTMYDVSMTPEKIENHEKEVQNEAVVTEVEEKESSSSPQNSQQENATPDITITEIEDYVEDDNITDQVLINPPCDDKDIAENMGTLDKRVHFQVSESLSDPEPIEKSSTPADENENLWSKINDHEYEPIGKPAAEVTAAADQVYIEDDASSTTSQEREVLRLPLDQATGDNEAYSGTDDRDTASSAIAMQKQMEDRYFVNTPTTTESRTDCEISTSQVDSSAIEDLPLKRENRKRASMEASRFQQKIKNQTGKLRNQAGKLRTKLKGMKKPQFSMPERPKFERPKFTMPERPKINLPDRPKISLPDRPRFKLPERPKLPDRPKINFPDRPKFSFPDRPKFSLPDRSKFKFPDRPKINFSTFTRNKENNRRTEDEHDPSTESTSGSKKNILNFDFRTYPRFFNRNKKDKFGASSANRPGTPPPTFATVPRVKKERLLVGGVWDESSARSTEDQPRQYGVDKDYSYKNDKDFESKLAQVDKDYRQMQAEYEQENLEIQKTVKAKLENAELWNAMERSNAAKIDHRVSLPYILPSEETRDPAFDRETGHEDDESSAASAGNHRRGVLEEIDNDEFFLRQKGISQDNIEVGKYLTDEIRDAFRSPVNALSQMDKGDRYEERNVPDTANFNYPQQDDRYYQFNKDDSVEQDEPMEYHQNENGFMAENDDGYYTFPPVRPSRARKMKGSKQAEESNSYMRDSVEPEPEIQVHHMAIESIPAPDMFSEPISQSYSEEESLDNMRINSFGYKDPDILENLNEYENEMEQTVDMPAVPKRRKKNTKEPSSYIEDEPFHQEEFDNEKWDEPIDNEDKSINDEVVVHRVEYIVEKYASPEVNEVPVLPRRTRSRSRGSRATSVGDDDRTSRGAESIVLDSHTQLPTADTDFLDDLDDGPGYAIVDKIMSHKTIEPAPQPPAPFRRHRSAKSLSSDRDYFTVPRALEQSSPPKRPLRNYSTLGPSRPPRKKFSTTSLTNLDDLVTNEPGSDATQYVEIDDEDQEIHKDLKSGEVISKMKDRPLPPPPRPPRGPKKKKQFPDQKDYLDDPEIDPGVFEFNESFQLELDNKKMIEDLKRQEHAKESEICAEEDANDPDPYYQDDVIEIEVSTQTDPLPDDFDYELGMEGIEFNDNLDCVSSTAEAQQETLKEDAEENSIDVEILSRGLQKFRESSRPSSRSGRPKTPSERQRTPTERPKTPLGRMSPTAILVERRVSSPTRINERDEIVTEASLTVLPIDEPLTFSSESKSFSSQNQACPDLPSFLSQAQSWQNREYFPRDEPECPVIIPECQAIEEECQVIMPECQVVEPERQVITPECQTVKPEHEVIMQECQVVKPERKVFKPERHIETKPPPPPCLDLDLDDECSSPVPVEVPRNLFQNANNNFDADVVRTQRLQVSDLEVDRLSVTELQAQKILVSEIEGLSLQVSDMNSKSGHIYVRGIDLAPGIVEEILQKFSQLSSQSCTTEPKPRSDTTQETQTEGESFSPENIPPDVEMIERTPTIENLQSPPAVPLPPPESPPVTNDAPITNDAPERPPLPTIPPSLYQMAYYPEYSLPPASFYRLRSPTERTPGDYSEDLPAAPSRRRKHKREPVSSSDEEYRPSARRQHVPRQNEPSVGELSVQLFRACQNSVTRTIQHILSYITSHFGTGEDKKDVQMALVIILVMIAGLIMLGVGDGRTVHHHHWDFFNPPTNEK